MNREAKAPTVSYPGSASQAAIGGDVSTVKDPNLVAFSKDRQKQLLYEFGVYFHLAQAQVKGVITVQGLFRDSDSGVVSLLIYNGG